MVLEIMHSSQVRPKLLETVLARALELRDAGNPDWLAEAVRNHPELEGAVREGADSSNLVNQLFQSGSSSDGLLGQTLGERYVLTRRIGGGAMGVVYQAEDSELARTVAIKVLREGLLDPEVSLQRFVREAEAMASVQHGSVITVHDRGLTEEGAAYIVMEWVPGATLTEVAHRGLARQQQGAKTKDPDGVDWLRVSLELDAGGESSYLRLVVRWIAELAAGLQAVHEAGVLHRDIKPSNILVRESGQPVLLDFGLALQDQDSSLTLGDSVLGTPAYMPPESLGHEERHSPASDVYSLTATLYHLVTLRPPYEGTPTEVLTGIATREPVRASKLRPGLPRELAAILDMGMHRRPRARYESAAALEADLRAFLDHRPIVARPVGALRFAARRVARSRMARGAALALGVVLLATGGWAWNDSYQASLDAQAYEVTSQLPPNFTLVGPANRVFRLDEDRAAVAGLLDRGVELGRQPVKLHLLRASFRLDHGDGDAAARDMRVVADELGGAYADALAARYANLPADAVGYAAVDLTGLTDLTDLPTPTTPHERYLEAYHQLRAGDMPTAFATLSNAELRALPHAEELRLSFTPLGGARGLSQYERALEDLTSIDELELILGGRTATTAQIGGRLLDEMGLYVEAMERTEEGLALAERSYILRSNAGFTALALGRPTDAIAHLEVAIDQRPNYRRPMQNLLWALVDLGEFDEALRRLDAAPLDEGTSTDQWRHFSRASVEVFRALQQRRDGELDAAAATVQRASAAMAAAEAIGSPGSLGPYPEQAILAGLEADDDEAVFLGLAGLLLDDPHNAWLLQDVIQAMPADLGPDASVVAREVLATLNPRQLTP
jgi:tRNA A-37 threonylcarbamoyl transferase component Bud32/tetratricopeptide (TPR) repeat protein